MSLRTMNSFGLPAGARRFFRLEHEHQVGDALRFLSAHPYALVLGGGSNIVLATDELAAVLAPRLGGRRIVRSDSGFVEVEVGAGENWHEVVCWSLEKALCGLENLALIPGLAGAAPVQNIGAYGVEIGERIVAVKACDRHTGEIRWISRNECAFSYRNSRFKHEPGRWLILALRLRLSRRFEPRTHYGELAAELSGSGLGALRADDVARAVIGIRSRKLPDPARLGNAGSFFKNPILPSGHAAALCSHDPGLARYPVPCGSDRVKIAAARLIDSCGWKGRTHHGAGVHAQHALVLVNHGTASGADLLRLAAAIQDDVWRRFAVKLEPEPLIVRQRA
ncbi:MAG: UDP-N-acetylmuramate dehydrogenase [Burkholderiaceae bacterium]